MPNDLKPCPFCGAKAVLKTARGGQDSELCWVECTGCMAQTTQYEDAYAPHPDAVWRWNTRI